LNKMIEWATLVTIDREEQDASGNFPRHSPDQSPGHDVPLAVCTGNRD
jgi:hypothetical protein